MYFYQYFLTTINNTFVISSWNQGQAQLIPMKFGRVYLCFAKWQGSPVACPMECWVACLLQNPNGGTAAITFQMYPTDQNNKEKEWWETIYRATFLWSVSDDFYQLLNNFIHYSSFSCSSCYHQTPLQTGIKLTSTLSSCLLCKRCACTQAEREPLCARALLCCRFSCCLVPEKLFLDYFQSLSWPHDAAARWSVF